LIVLIEKWIVADFSKRFPWEIFTKLKSSANKDCPLDWKVFKLKTSNSQNYTHIIVVSQPSSAPLTPLISNCIYTVPLNCTAISLSTSLTHCMSSISLFLLGSLHSHCRVQNKYTSPNSTRSRRMESLCPTSQRTSAPCTRRSAREPTPPTMDHVSVGEKPWHPHTRWDRNSETLRNNKVFLNLVNNY